LKTSFFRTHYFLPGEHGSWIWWLGPFAIGLGAAGRLQADVLWLLAATLSGFLLRQPVMILVKVLSRRRSRIDFRPALAWSLVYSATGFASAVGLAAAGHGALLLLILPGILLFGWQMWLVRKREDRGRTGTGVLGAGLLALAAPAAYWVSGGRSSTVPWILWVMCWLQSTASILLVYSRLEQRSWNAPASLLARFRSAGGAWMVHFFNAVTAVTLAALGWIPWLSAAGFLLMLIDLAEGTLRPAIGARPTHIGLRQLLASTVFAFLTVVGFALESM
jgi:hypothetical protein